MNAIARFRRYAAAVVCFNLFVIIWGAYVRASGSGAGCGAHWPLCNGEVVPRAAPLEMLVELFHRTTSGIDLLLVAGLVVAAFRIFPRGHLVRRSAAFSGVFLIVEALVGAGLVLLELVAHNTSVARAYWMAGHLINTFVLMMWLVLTWYWSRPAHEMPAALSFSDRRLTLWLTAMVVMIMVLGASGAVTALGDTLYLGAPEVDGVRQKLSPSGEFLVSLRVYHPMLAMLTGLALLYGASAVARLRPDRTVRRLAFTLGGLFLCQLLLGATNVALRAPIPVQLLHLTLTNGIWLTLVLLAARSLALPKLVAQPAPTQEAVAVAGD